MTNTLRGHSPLAPSKAVAAMPNPIVCLVVAIAIVGLASDRPAGATEMLRCARFGQGELPAPVPSPYPSAIERADRISHAVKSAPYSVLFFGDSLTEGWDTTVWEDYLAPRGVLNAGVSGDRTDNLLWRLEHGNLAGPQPKAVVLLIGTNDLAYGRSPARAADGIRANLEVLRQHLPEARILLLGLLPRDAVPSAPLRIEVAQVNRLIRDCADDQHIFYAEIGDVLLTSDGLLSAEVSPDQLHFSARGYALLAARLEPELDRLLRGDNRPNRQDESERSAFLRGDHGFLAISRRRGRSGSACAGIVNLDGRGMLLVSVAHGFGVGKVLCSPIVLP